MSNSTALDLKKTLRTAEGFSSLPVEVFRLPTVRGIDIFTLPERNRTLVLLCGSRHQITEDQIEEVESRETDVLYVRNNVLKRLSEDLLYEIDPLIEDESLSIEARGALVQLAYQFEIERCYRKLTLDQYSQLARTLGRSVTEMFLSKTVNTPRFYRFLQHGDSSSVHLTNVCFYSVILATKLGIVDPRELEQIAVGALLHEVGKLFLPPSLLHKTGRLAPHEVEELERAPQLGYETLLEKQIYTSGQLMMAYQHAERVDGSGYPVAVLGDEIHPWAKILAVVDVFDAKTANRLYRRASNLFDTLVHLGDGANRHFDLETVLCWNSAFQQQ